MTITEIKKVYAGGELVFDNSGNIIPDPPVEIDMSFAFAEIPEQVFASGWADSEDMNLYHLQPNNLYPAGNLPWETKIPFTPSNKCRLITVGGGPLPTGVTWNENTGFLSYDGTSLPGDNEIVECYFTQTDTFKNSQNFYIKLLMPTLEWDMTDGRPMEDAVNTAFANNTRSENLLLLKDGAYWGYDLRNGSANGYLNCFTNRDNVYILGEPGKMPSLRGTKTDDWALEYDPVKSNYGTRVYLRMGGTVHQHVKGIDLTFAQIGTGSRALAVLNKIKFHTNPDGTDGWVYGFINDPAGPPNPTIFINNFEVYHMGAWGTLHAIYGHFYSQYVTDNILFQGTVIINNLKSYETKGPGGTGVGGIGYKDLTMNTTIRNSFISKTKDGTNSTIDKAASTQLFSLHSIQRVVFFNNTINFCTYGSAYCLLFQDRSCPTIGAFDVPTYFSWPNMVGGSPDANSKVAYAVGVDTWNGTDVYSGDWVATKDPNYHGENANNDYTLNGAGIKDNGALVPAPGFLQGCTIDPAGITKVTISASQNSPVWANLDGSFWQGRYTKSSAYPTTATFTVKVTDANGQSNTATVTVNMNKDGAAATAPGSIGTEDLGNPPILINNTFDVFNMNYDSEIENPGWTPIDAPYWDSLGDPSDILSDEAKYKFISHCRFNYIEGVNDNLNEQVIDSRTTATHTVSQQFGPAVWLSAPPNWKELSWVHMVNNTFNGFQQSAQQKMFTADFTYPNTTFTYPHAPDKVAKIQNNYTEYGGDIKDGVGTNIDLPNNFRI